MNKPELLAPAGDMEKLKTALYFGADAVYLGGPGLHLRAASADFTLDDLQTGVEYAHGLGKRVYVTVNAFARNGDFETLPEYAQALSRMGVDAVLVADIGVLAAVKKAAPSLPVHISTQANCTNYAAANAYHDLGASRVVLARELSMEEIGELRSKIHPGLELEVFIHGAMCMAYSGRCLISSYLTGRDSNRGGCAQPCRWTYALMEESRPGEYFPVYEEDGFTTILSSCDLNTMAFVDQLADMGIDSLKIEGRIKSPYYVATVINAYRRRLDGSAPVEQLEQELLCASHRAQSSGFYFGELKRHTPDPGIYHQNCLFIGPVLEQHHGRILVEQRNRFGIGDRLEVLSPHSLGDSFIVEGLWDRDGAPLLEAIHPQEAVWVSCPFSLSPGDLLRRRISD